MKHLCKLTEMCIWFGRRIGWPRHKWEVNINWILKEYDGKVVKSYGSGEGYVVSSCEHGNECVHSIKYRGCLD